MIDNDKIGSPLDEKDTTENYKVGGPLKQEDTTYVVREADKQLYDALKAREFCYVLDSRQSGKSSLCIRTRLKFKEDPNIDIDDVYISLLGCGAVSTPEEWYNGQIIEIIKGLNINIDFNKWWNSYLCSPLQKYKLFIEEILLVKIKKNIVIFVDEIDTVLSSSIDTDDFFGFIKYCYEQREHNPKYNCLTFCLLGRTSPHKLINDTQRTPFNIGQGIILKPFQFDPDKLKPLIKGLEGKCNQPEEVMKEIIYWTGGQPFLTQLLCQLMVEDSTPKNSDSVEQVVTSKIINYISSGNDYDAHFSTIRDHLLCRRKDKENHNIYVRDKNRSFALLSLYQKVLLASENTVENDSLQMELKLTGIVVQKESKLEVYNPIYEQIFHNDWVQMQKEDIRFYTRELDAWIQEKKKENGQQDFYLLYGCKYDEAWKLKEKIEAEEDEGLFGSEVNFLYASQKFWENAKNSLPDDSDYEELVKNIISWTGGIKIFDDFIFIISKKYFKRENTKPVEQGKEEKWVKTLLQTHLIEKYANKKIEDEKLTSHLQKTEDNIVNYTDPLLILSQYREILEQEEINFNDSPEYQKLTNLCLIIKEGNKLKIINKIYPLLFDQEWVDQTLKHILVNKKWQSATEDEKSQAVEIITTFSPQLKGKTNPLYGFIQKVLEHTVSKHDLLENLLEKACKQEYISSEHQDEWIKQQLNLLKPNGIIDQEILTRIKSYEKAIVSKYSQYSKPVIDYAFCQLIKQFVEKFDFSEYIEPQNSNINIVIQYCIDYLTKNLIKNDIWNEDDRPKIEQEGVNRWKISISNCSYQEECKWALETEFVNNKATNQEEKYKNYRCQRLGCCVGAVKECMNENLDYSMTTVIDEAKGCQGFIFKVKK